MCLPGPRQLSARKLRPGADAGHFATGIASMKRGNGNPSHCNCCICNNPCDAPTLLRSPLPLPLAPPLPLPLPKGGVLRYVGVGATFKPADGAGFSTEQVVANHCIVRMQWLILIVFYHYHIVRQCNLGHGSCFSSGCPLSFFLQKCFFFGVMNGAPQTV